MKRALITGITGQDGSYLADLLLTKGYEVHGLIRRASTFNTERIEHLYRDPHDEDVRLWLHYGDLTDASQLSRLVRQVQPDEIYNMAAQSHVRVSFDQPEYTGNTTGLGVTRLLEAIRETGGDPAVPSLILGDVRQRSRTSIGGDAIPSAFAVRGGQVVRALDGSKLSRGLWPLRRLWNPVQPRR